MILWSTKHILYSSPKPRNVQGSKGQQEIYCIILIWISYFHLFNGLYRLTQKFDEFIGVI